MYLRTPLFLLASILSLASTTSALLNLFDIQQINNFPTRCTSAYDVDIIDCDRNEITVTGQITSQGEGICSIQCIAALTVINRNLMGACAGVQASPDTLIGLFFGGKGITYLCPNSVDGVGPAPSSTGDDDLTSASSTTSSSPSSSSSSSSPSSEPPAVATDTSITSSSSAPPPATVSGTPTPAPSFQPTTAANNGIATVLTSEAQRSDSANPDAFGGGGSPFEVSENSSSTSRNGVPVAILVSLFWGGLMGFWMLLG